MPGARFTSLPANYWLCETCSSAWPERNAVCPRCGRKREYGVRVMAAAGGRILWFRTDCLAWASARVKGG